MARHSTAKPKTTLLWFCVRLSGDGRSRRPRWAGGLVFRNLNRFVCVQALGAVLIMLAAGFASSSPISAHAELVKSDPASDALLGAPPQEINLWFSEAVDSGAGSPAVEIIDEHG